MESMIGQMGALSLRIPASSQDTPLGVVQVNRLMVAAWFNAKEFVE